MPRPVPAPCALQLRDLASYSPLCPGRVSAVAAPTVTSGRERCWCHGYRIHVAALSGEMKLDGGGESTCATTIASSSKSKSTAQVDEYHTGYDDSLDDPAQYMFPHEKFRFGYMSSRPVPQELLFKGSDYMYLRCKDFGQIYNELVNSAPRYCGSDDHIDALCLEQMPLCRHSIRLIVHPRGCGWFAL